MSFYEDTIKTLRADILALINAGTLDTKWHLEDDITDMPDPPVIFVDMGDVNTESMSGGDIALVSCEAVLVMMDHKHRHNNSLIECEEYIWEEFETLMDNLKAEIDPKVRCEPGTYKKRSTKRLEAKITLYG